MLRRRGLFCCLLSLSLSPTLLCVHEFDRLYHSGARVRAPAKARKLSDFEGAPQTRDLFIYYFLL